MGPITIVLGLLLIVDGAIAFVATGSSHYTALIPAGFGVVFAVLGWLARQDQLRKHVMHAAAALGLLGFIGGAITAWPDWNKFLSGSPESKPVALVAKSILAISCAVFVGLCVKSFVDARRRRIAGEIASQV